MAVEGTQTLEKSLIAPQSDTEHTLSLTFFDVGWIHFQPIKRLLFYKFPCSKTHFLETLVPSFKASLSKTLKLYLPLSGNLYYPDPPHEADPSMSEIRYTPGDSVSLTVAEYSSGEEYFNYLTGNSQRDCDKFYDLFPDLPEPRSEPGFQIIPLLSLQITLFPGVGICVGFTNHHVAGDANSIVGFLKAWSIVAELGEIQAENSSDLLPIFDRSLVKDPKGLRNILWKPVKSRAYEPRSSIPPKGKVRATYILQESHLEKLKGTVRTKKPHLTHISSFTVTAAYVWACLAKSSSEQVRGDEPEHFAFPVDLRTRVDPPLPLNYFGNCLGAAFVETTHADLIGEDGFFIASELISNVISNEVSKKGELLRDAENWRRKYGALVGKRLLSVAGSPKFDLYVVDFGWGKPHKYEALSIDGENSMSLSTSGEFEGGLEIGLALPKEKMDAFAEYFYRGGLEV